MDFDLFVMVTDGQIDHVEMPPSAQQEPEDVCLSSHILCGTWNKPYPDARPMGYPFDRRPYSVPASGGGERPVDDLEEFVMPIPNMKVITVSFI
jgi:tyrosinase